MAKSAAQGMSEHGADVRQEQRAEAKNAPLAEGMGGADGAQLAMIDGATESGLADAVALGAGELSGVLLAAAPETTGLVPTPSPGTGPVPAPGIGQAAPAPQAQAEGEEQPSELIAAGPDAPTVTPPLTITFEGPRSPQAQAQAQDAPVRDVPMVHNASVADTNFVDAPILADFGMGRFAHKGAGYLNFASTDAGRAFDLELELKTLYGDKNLNFDGTQKGVDPSGVLEIWGTEGNDDLTRAAHFNNPESVYHVYALGGDDTLRGAENGDILNGGNGSDTVDYSASTGGVRIDLNLQDGRTAQSGGQAGSHAEGDVLIGIENVIGTRFDDVFIGNNANNTFFDRGGHDSINGGVGFDMVDYSASTAWVNVDLNVQDGATAQSGGGAGNHAAGDTLLGIEGVTGSMFDDSLTGDAYNNKLIGLDGNDTIHAGAGNDTLNGGAGHDLLDGGDGAYDMADYSTSTAWVNVDLNIQDGRAQSGGGAGNHADGDTLFVIEDVRGSSFNDVLTGNYERNHLYGGDGNDTMRGDDGKNFSVNYWNGDTLYGEGGNDYMVGSNGRSGDSMFGGDGNDTMYGGKGIDSMWGNAGDDYMYGGAEDGTTSYGNQDLLIGGTGNDTLVASAGTGSGRNTLIGCEGADRIIGDGHNTEVSYEIYGNGYVVLNYRGVYVDLNIQDGHTAQSGGPAGNDAIGDILSGVQHVVGSYGSDTILGDSQNNEIYALDGDDLVTGGAGVDSLWGNNGKDTLEGGTGADFMWGGRDYDMISYEHATQGVRIDLRGMGPTSCAVQRGAGEENGDQIWYSDGVIGSNFNDTLIATNNGFVLSDGTYIDVRNLLEGRGGDDILAGLSYGDTLDGGDGSDTADYSLSTAAVNIDLALQGGGATQSGGATGNDGDGDVLISIENVIGSAYNDTLLGDGGDNKLAGLAGADAIDGRGGVNTVDYSASTAAVLVDLNLQDGTTAQGGGAAGNHADGDILQNIQNAMGSAGNDTLIGDTHANVLSGMGGNDVITAGAGDTVDGGAGNDVLHSSSASLDLASSTRIAGIERVDISDAATDLTLNGDAILNNGVLDPAGSGHKALVVNVNAGDSVHIQSDGWTWSHVGDGMVIPGDGHTYTAYEGVHNGETVRLYVETGTTPDFPGKAAPVGADFSMSAQEDVSLAFHSDDFVTNGHYADNDTTVPAKVMITDLADHGTLYLDGVAVVANQVISYADLGKLTYVSSLDYNGDDAFHFKASDGLLWSNETTVTLHVAAVNDAPVVDNNSQLEVHELVSGNLAGELHATDVDNTADQLLFSISDGPDHGVLAVNGVDITDFSSTAFTQEDIDNNLVTFRYVPKAQATAVAFTDDTFTFSVSDGELGTATQTFTIHNDVTQVWGTNTAEDLTTLTNFDDPAATFHVYGFNGDDTLRAGILGDTLDGGTGYDTADYSASTAFVRVDLNVQDGATAQSGGGAGNHAEGDVLVNIENVIGTQFNDVFLGNNANNSFTDLGGVDSINGGAGLDMVDYHASTDWVNVDLNVQDGTTAQSGGGAGNHAAGDTLVGMECVTGSSYNDVLTGNATANKLVGLDGNDTIVAGAGNDTLIGGAGSDRLDGGAGTRDFLDYSASTDWVRVDLTVQDGATAQSGGGAGNHAAGDILTGIEDVNGSNYDDVLIGNGFSNLIRGLDGDDTIYGCGNTSTGGYDTLYGDGGNDYMVGSKGWDSIYGGTGNDTLYGGRGVDSLWGGAGDDYLYGGDPDGTTSYGYQDLLFGGTGIDTLVASQNTGGGRTSLVGCEGADVLIGDGHNTEITYEVGGDYFNINYGQTVYIDLNVQDGYACQRGGSEGNDAIGDTVTGTFHIVGAYHVGGDTLIAGPQASEIYGLDGHDSVRGGAGNDSIWGNDGNDTLEGGVGGDFMWGGYNYDMISYEHAAGGVKVDLRAMGPVSGAWQSGAGEAYGDDIWYSDGIIGSNYNDTLIATNNFMDGYISINNLLEGRGGDDILAGLSSGDTLDGGDGSDTADYSLSTAAVNIDLALQGGGATQSGGATGNDGDGDVLISIENVIGTSGNDTLLGDGANNTFTGLAGADYIDGRGGSNTVAYNGSTAGVRIDLSLPAGTPQSGGDAEGDIIYNIQNVIGTAFNDTLIGNDQDNVLAGLGGGDLIRGYGGVNTVDYHASTAAVYIDLNIQDGTWQDKSPVDSHAYGDILLEIQNVIGSAYNDSILGDAQDNLFEGGAGADTLDGQGGVNTVDYHTSAAGVSVDLRVQDGATAQSGGATGNDAIGDILQNFRNVIGSAHNDTLIGDGNGNVLRGLDGNDQFAGLGGADTIDGGNGVNTVDYSLSTAAVLIDLNVQDGTTAQSGGFAGNHAEGDVLTGIQNVIGTAFNDTLIGDGRDNLLIGLAGADRIDGAGGVNTVDYSASTAAVSIDLGIQDGTTAQSGGDAGNHAEGDILTGIQNLAGSAYNDTLIGDARNNVLSGLGGADRIDGAAGVNTVDYSLSIAAVHVDLSLQDGTTAQGGGAAGNHADGDILQNFQNVVGSAYADTLIGDANDNVLAGGAGADHIDGGGGINTVDYSASIFGVRIDLNIQDGVHAQLAGQVGNDAIGDVLKNIQNVIGSNQEDFICGDDNDNVLYGMAGNDVLIGGGGNDTLYGGDGVNSLHGYSGDDVLHLSLNTVGLLDSGGTILPTKIGMLDGGSGVDTLVLDGHGGSGVTLDLHGLVASGKIAGIEHIDITGGTGDNNTMTLKASDVFGTARSHSLFIEGDAGDSVTTTDSGWSSGGGDVTVGGHTYHHYVNGVENLYVDITIDTQNIIHP